MMHGLLRAAIGACGVVLLFAANSFADAPAPVPEPVSMTLLAVGGVGLYFVNRRRS